MKKQIKRVSIHQNAKVLSLLMAISSLFMLVPMFAIMAYQMPSHDAQGNPIDSPYAMFVIMPIFYLVFGYISIAIGSWIYNFLAKKIGGFEYETQEKSESV